ncbi:MAG: ribosome small subunit-dependent GTPase A [Candidatus Cloacimonetes bacterium]|nr:ribosome small subunit-dependent GTPase A [Candidatus Cloacimonadota bacterium]
MRLDEIGWNSFFAVDFEQYKDRGWQRGRVAQEQKNLYWIFTEEGEEQALLSDKLFENIFASEELPAVGDWVLFRREPGFDKVFIEVVLPRQSKFSRKGKDTYGRNYTKNGTSEEQVISANIDTVFLIMSMDRDFNLRKLERYLTLIWDSGANPVIVLNKADLCDDVQWYLSEAESVVQGMPLHVISALQNEGIDELRQYIKPGKTVTFTGSSGVGKSSIINRLLGEEKQYVSYVREGDKRGRHTTTSREMIIMPEGGILIDNPGMRDIKLSVNEEVLDRTFSDIVELIPQCRFRNCQHETEPGCAIKAAIEKGELTLERYENFVKLQREARFYEQRKRQREKNIENMKYGRKYGNT